jgi:predicted RNA-binding protein with PIN domain
MRHFIIDGNNLIGKTSVLQKLQKKDRQLSREKLAFILESYFISKTNNKATLHLDGFPNIPINVRKIKVIYSGKKTADDQIKLQIENEKNSRNLVVVTSDNNLKQFAKVCGCEWRSSEDFSKEMLARSDVDDEAKRIKEMDNNDEFRKLFDV